MFLATYGNGSELRRKRISAPNRLDAYATAIRSAPRGFTLTHLRVQKGRK